MSNLEILTYLRLFLYLQQPTINNQLVFIHSNSSNEFWAALLEKAYAKLHGSYEHLEGGFFSEALVDFTGGIPQFIELKKSEPKEFFSKMIRAQDNGALIGASILTPTKPLFNGVYANGLYPNHAYTITKVVQYKGEITVLI